MAKIPEIKIQLDEDGIKAQLQESIGSQFRDFSMRLRVAADDLDGGKWWDEHREYIEAEYDRGYQDGLKAKESE